MAISPPTASTAAPIDWSQSPVVAILCPLNNDRSSVNNNCKVTPTASANWPMT
jgi:hypothetical protein